MGSDPDGSAGRTRARFLDCPPADDGRHRHDPERQFFGPGYHPGDYVFTFVTDALRIRTRSDSGSTASPRRPWSRAFPSMGHYATHTQRRPEDWRESENRQRAHRAKHRHFPVARLANTAVIQRPSNRKPRSRAGVVP